MSNAKVRERMVLSVEVLKENLHYDPLTGIFTRKISISNRVEVGDIAGTFSKSTGYIKICINGELYRAHRLAWLYMTGVMSKKMIDHKNGIRSDNRFSNLREATSAENLQNQKKSSKNSTTGLLGVSFYKQTNKYSAKISINGKSNHIGYFDTPQEAHAAYLMAKKELHPFSII